MSTVSAIDTLEQFCREHGFVGIYYICGLEKEKY